MSRHHCLFIYSCLSNFFLLVFAFSSVQALDLMKIDVYESGSLTCVDCMWTEVSICSNAVSSLRASLASDKWCV